MPSKGIPFLDHILVQSKLFCHKDSLIFEDDSDEEQVGSMYSSEEMGLDALPDLDEFISRFDSDSGETEVGDDDLLDALQSFLKAQGVDSSEETVAVP